jgi:hypothetical protein
MKHEDHYMSKKHLLEYDNKEDHDEREGRSPSVRKMYIEAKDMKKDKAVQLRELEKYM